MKLLPQLRLLGLVVVAGGTLAVSCGGDNVTCGSGTTKSGSQCVASAPTNKAGTSGSSDNDAGLEASAGGMGGSPTTTIIVGSAGEGGAGGESAGPGDVPVFSDSPTVAPISKTSLLVVWPAATDPVTSSDALIYNVYIATSSGHQNFRTPQLVTPAGKTFAEIDSLEAGQTYYVVVRAVNAAGIEDTNTNEGSAATAEDADAPTFAGITSATAAGPVSVKLKWSAPAKDKRGVTPAAAIVYLAYWSDTAGLENFNIPIAVSDPGATELVVTGLPTPETKYYFVVRAQDAAGNIDDNTVEITGKTGADTQAPSFGGCVLADPVSATSVNLVWKSATDDVSTAVGITYGVYASKTPGGQDFDSPPQGSFLGGTSGIVDGLNNSSTYYFVCRAQDSSANQDSNTFERSATTLNDSTPPTFGGITGVTNISSTTLDLQWTAATDDHSAAADIVYDVYESATKGGEIYTKPTAVSAAGATTVTLSGLASNTLLYFVVRARDKAGNETTNIEEQSATTFVSFANDIQAGIFDVHCTASACHSGINPASKQNLTEGQAYNNIVNVNQYETASDSKTYKRILPGDAANSYMYMKITADPRITGQQMPASNESISALIPTLKNWIVQGAKNN
jgi:Fibronectin type III domain